MNYEKLGKEIITLVGGKENIQNVTHCVTRLRFVLGDESKADVKAINELSGVLKVVQSSGQFQVVIGNEVANVYKAVVAELGEGFAPQKVEQETKEKGIKGLFKQALDTLVGCFVPSIPAIAGAGMIKVLVVLLNFMGILEMGSSTYQILNTIGDGIFYFLPFFVAYNAAKKMETDIFLAMSLAAIVMHPNLAALGSEGATSASFAGIPMQIMDYSAQALPMIFGVWVLKYANRLADKVSPNIVKVFLRPMLALLITAPIVLILIGPAAIVLSQVVFKLCLIMQEWGWLAVAINAALFPLMVLTGTHNATIPLIIQMFATQGFDSIFLPCGMAANIAEAGAACAVAVKTKNKELKATGYSATFSALLGITEPALYGVNLRMGRPFIAMLIGSFIGGGIIGLVGLTAPAFVTPSLLTIAVFAGKSNFLLSLATIPLTFMITFVITFIMGFKDLD